MSTHAIRLVEISLSEREARERAPVVTSWLLEREVIAPNPRREELWSPSEFRAGPRYTEVAPDELGHVGGGDTGVDIVVDQIVHHAVENYEPPTCPGCGAEAISFEEHHELLGPWLYHRVEPEVACVACGHTTPAGNLEGSWSFHIGELAVVFNNWPPLTMSFVAELSSVMGPRTRVVIAVGGLLLFGGLMTWMFVWLHRSSNRGRPFLAARFIVTEPMDTSNNLHGQSGLHRTQIYVHLPVPRPTLEVRQVLRMESRINEGLGPGDIKVGHPEFDARFQVTCADERLARAVLAPQVVEFLLHDQRDCHGFWIRGTQFEAYNATGQHRDPTVLAADLDIRCDLLDRIPSHVWA